MAPPPQGIRIAELARRSGTTKETIHFYLREGLLRKPRKTSRNMAYYDETHLEQLKLIKRLRSESYLPLHVIKKVLKEGKLGSSARQLDLAGELFGQGARAEFEPLSRRSLAERTGSTEKRIGEWEEAGLLRPTTIGGKKRYGYEDVRVAEILKNAEEEMGEGGEAVVTERFRILEGHMAGLVKDEVAHFFSRVVAEGDPRRALELLRGGRETIGKFLALARARRLKEEVEAMMPAIEAALTSSAPEPLYLPIPIDPALAAREVERRALLLARFEKRSDDPQLVRALFEHLVLAGEVSEVPVLFERVRGRARETAAVQLLVGEALLVLERLDEGFAILDELRQRRRGPGLVSRRGVRGPRGPRGADAGEPGDGLDALLEALWGVAVLTRLRRNFASLQSSTELIGYITRAFSAFDNARAALPEDLLMSARIHLLLGRVLVAAPEFLGTRRQGRADLLSAIDEVEQLRQKSAEPRPAGEPARGKADLELELCLADLSYGALERLEQNARHFLPRP